MGPNIQTYWRCLPRSLTLIFLLSAASLACSDRAGDEITNNAQPDASEAPDTSAPDADLQDIDGEGPADDGFVQVDCDELQPEHCALPWPSNAYLKPDDTRQTGFSLSFGAETLPTSWRDVKTRPDPWQRLDGYGPGSALLVYFDGLDIAEMAGEESIERSLQEDAPIVWLELDEDGSVKRKIPYFVEFDTRKTTKKPEETLLFVRPAVILDLSTRYIVAFRNLKDTDGAQIDPSPAFQKLLDGESDDDEALSSRQPRFDEIFSTLEGEGINKDELTLAWDFVTGSSESLHGPMLAVRDQGLELAGASGPALKIDEVVENPESEDEKWWLEINGRFESPHFMRQDEVDSQLGWVFNFDEAGQPQAEGTHENEFWLRVPHSARDGSAHGLIQYGHGLLGNGGQTNGGHNREVADAHQFIYFGTTLVGMSDDDIGSASFALQDLNAFPFIADRLHQGLLDFMVLARAMREQLPGLDELTSRDITVNPDELFYSGISQGGIFGATYLALSQDITLGHLGVPGNNYSTLLHRSVDFDMYAAILIVAYPDAADQVVALSALQLLWDQTDPVSYLRHLSKEPLPDTPAHRALFAPAKGDHQVAVFTNEVAARSDIGIELMEHYGKEVDLIDPQAYPYTGSGVVLYDYGNPWPEPGNRPPADEMDDPHDLPRYEDAHNEQMVHFFRSGGEIIDVCEGAPCTFE